MQSTINHLKISLVEVVKWYEKNEDIPKNKRLNWFVLYKFADMLGEYRELRNQGYNPAWHLAKFSDLLSYGTAWGEGADAVVTRMRQRIHTKDTVARVLLKPGDWPIQKA